MFETAAEPEIVLSPVVRDAYRAIDLKNVAPQHSMRTFVSSRATSVDVRVYIYTYIHGYIERVNAIAAN